MNIYSQIILALLIANALLLVVVAIIWRNKETKFSEFLLSGSYIYRDIEKYIRKDKSSIFLTVSYSGIGLFIMLIASMVITSN